MPTPTPTSELKLRQLVEREERVFPSYPQATRYFPSASIEEARQRLGRTINRGDGPGLVIGAPGTGKSLLLQVLAAQFHERFDVVLLACARLCTRRALLQAVLFELGLPYKLRDEGELRLSLLDHLLSPKECPEGLLLLVDEAQVLPIALLDELRVMTNVVRSGVPRVRLVLAGSSALEEAFAHQELESFSQRLSARCYLAPLGRDETIQFIRAQVAACGGAPDELFAADAWGAIFEASDGVPRLVNQLCDRALLLAANECCSLIDGRVVEAAWSDLQQLPTPWETPPSSPAASATDQVIEFSGLSNDVRADDDYDEESIAVVEPTELDFDDDAVGIPIEESSSNCQTESLSAIDPFAERFEEEEVVLDNFAAWDDMFRRDTPRVENRRDPGFATLVQAAIEAAPACGRETIKSPQLAPWQEFDADEVSADSESDVATDLLTDAPSHVEASKWPTLRLAVVSESAPIETIPLAAASVATNGAGDATFDLMRPTIDCHSTIDGPAVDETAVLVIEEDSEPTRGAPVVRRGEYRHLFTRLRSG